MSKTRSIILSVVLEGRSQAETARRYDVTEAWVSILVRRYRNEGAAAFEPRSRRPKTSPIKISEPTSLRVFLMSMIALTEICNHQRPHRSLGRTTPAIAYNRLPKAHPGNHTRTEHRVRKDMIDNTAKSPSATKFTAVADTDRGIIGVNGGCRKQIGIPFTYTAVLTNPKGGHLKALEINRQGWEDGAEVWPQARVGHSVSPGSCCARHHASRHDEKPSGRPTK